MISPSTGRYARRDFLRVSALAMTGFGLAVRPARAEPPPEIRTLRLTKEPYACQAPEYIVDEFLAAEGFSGAEHVEIGDSSGIQLVAKGELDFELEAAPSIVTLIDAGQPLVALAGLHGGCYGLFATERVRSIRDLKGKTVAVLAPWSVEQILLSAMAAYVGLDPRRDIKWVHHPFEEAMRLLAEGKVDAYMAFPPEPQELRAKRIGRVIVNTTTDRPWSQQFRCMLVGNRQWVQKYPVATKRLLRAMLKATDLCAREPDRVTQYLVDKGYTTNLEYTMEVLRNVTYAKWRTDDPEATLRFYALRLRDVGMVKATPQKIIAQGTDWRFLNELKKELKG
jgi:NitT/TauT family transport system substrate-binding protein